MTEAAKAWVAEWASEADLDDVLEAVELATAEDAAVQGVHLRGVVDSVFWCLVTGDDGRVAGVWREWVVAALARARVADNSSLLDGLGLVGAATLLAASGEADDPAPLLAQWLSAACDARDELSDQDRTSYLLACVAHGFDDFAGRLMADMTHHAFEAGPFAGGPLPDFADRLAGAAAARTSMSEIEPLWRALVAGFPARVDNGWGRWSDLLHAGFAVHRRFGGVRPEEIVAAIRADVVAHRPSSGVAALRPSDAEVREVLQQVDDLVRVGGGLVSVGGAVLLAANALIPHLLFGDRAVVARAVPALIAALARARVEPPNDRSPSAAVGAASGDVLAATLLAGFGEASDPSERLVANLPVLLRAAAENRLGADGRSALALTCAALGQIEPLETLTSRPLIPFVAGKTFGAHRAGLVGYLAAAHVAGADRMALEPAWRSFLDALPAALEQGDLGWSDVLYVWHAVNGPVRRHAR